MSSLFLAGLLQARIALGLIQLQGSSGLLDRTSVDYTLGVRSSAASTLASRTSSALAAFSRAGLDLTYGLRPAEFASVMESSWRSGAEAGTRAAQGANETHTTRCQDAQPGSMCYHATEWLMARGLAKHTSWYPSLSEDSLMHEVQSALHKLGKAFCPRPCETRIATRLAQSPDDKVLEVEDSGRQVVSQGYELSPPTECGDIVEGDWCYLSIVWLKNIGLRKHPTWYSTLIRESSMHEFQTVLHNEGKVGCPLPCSSASNAPDLVVAEPAKTLSRLAVVSPSAMKVAEELEECQDAKQGSRCYEAVTNVLNVGVWTHPEEYPELATDCTFDEVQEHLYLRRQHECGRPCPKEPISKHHRGGRVKKNPKDMTEKELVDFLSHQWDGYVDADEYADVLRASGASGKENAFEEYTNAVAADGALHGQGAGGAPATAEVGACRDALTGELCHQAVTWARTVGILERPKWYSGLSGSSTFQEFQAYLHKERGSLCPMPCPDAAGAPSVSDAAGEEPAPRPEAATEESATGEATEAQSSPSEGAALQEPAANDSMADAGPASAEPGAQSVGDAAAANDTAADLPVVDGDGLEFGSTVVRRHSSAPEVATEEAAAKEQQEPQPRDAAEEANVTGEEEPVPQPRAAAANSTAEEPAPQPEATAVEAEANFSTEPLPMTPWGLVNSTAEEPEAAAVEAEASILEEPLPWLANDEEPAPQQEAVTVEANFTGI